MQNRTVTANLEKNDRAESAQGVSDWNSHTLLMGNGVQSPWKAIWQYLLRLRTRIIITKVTR